MGVTQPVWEVLFPRAMTLISEIQQHGSRNAFWTFGGGTVLMLRYNHRFSKDIDIFVSDPQALGFVNPRLSDVAESLTNEYVEAANFVKLYFPEGEIDFVAAPNLTRAPFESAVVMGYEVRLETSVEIIAKKLWHRGHAITGRDIFDFALVAEKDPAGLLGEAPFMVRHAETIHDHLETRKEPLRAQFNAVDALDFHPDFDASCAVLLAMLEKMRRQ